MKAKTAIISLLLVFNSLTYADESGYTIIEDKADLPLLNPSLAERKVLKLRLDNGLQAFLISDPGAKQSAAALSVEAGSWDDPKTYPGMAHFLEHMLFMGTAAFPKESEYMQFIADHGGLVNAYTASDRTVYMFSINNETFDGALERFSRFFIDPLFMPSCIGRELHAVDQEHSKNIENDLWREYMILKETGNPSHPNAAFSTGNAKTLSGIPQSALKEWYHEHYSASKMHLAVISTEPLEELTAKVVKEFSAVPNREITAESAPFTQFASPEQMGHIIYIKPIKDLRRLSLVWEVPPAVALDNEKKAIDLVAYVLKNNSKNSLLEELKREKLAEDLDISGDRFSKDQLLFRIDIDLTKQGLEQADTVIMRCFQAINRLKQTGVPQSLFEEMKTLAKLSYQYQSREDAFSAVTQLADEMPYEDLQTYPEKTSIPSTYDPHFISGFIQTLTPASAMVFVQADPQLTGIAPDKKEKWMNAEYAIREIPQEKITALSNTTAHPQIDLPPANPFVPNQLALVPASNETSQSPQLISDDVLSKVYFAQDNKYFVPEMAAIYSLRTPQIDGSAKKAALLDLYLRALSDQMATPLFFAQTAGLHTAVGQKDLKLVVSVEGYSQKAPELIKLIFQNLKKVSCSVDQFEIYKHSLASGYDNLSKELPVRQAAEVLSNIIYNDAPLPQEKLKALKAISYDDFTQFSKNLLKSGFLEGMVYGNLTRGTAASLTNDIKNTLALAPYPKELQLRKQVLVLPEKHGPYMLQFTTERQGNGTLLLLEQGPFSFEKKASQQVLSKALQDAFFDTLRTKQQTAYIARSWDVEVERQLLQFFAVQSNSHHPSELLARFELFLEDFLVNFQERLSPDRFETIREMLIVTLKKTPENLALMNKRFYDLAFTYDGDFAWIDKCINTISQLSYQQLATDANQFLSRKNQKRLAVLMEGVLPAEKDFHYERISQEDVRDLGTFVTYK